MIAGLVFAVAGVVAYVAVQQTLSDQKIVVSDDADMFGGKAVDGPLTAYSQAIVIGKHAKEIGGGKTYAELPQDDPNRDTVMTASFLQASLFTSVVAFGVSALAVVLGILLMLVGWALRRLSPHGVATRRRWHDGRVSPPQTPLLVADCQQCFALCCVLLPFSAVSGFGVDKPGGTPCLNLADDDRCTIHASLRRDGWSGCVTFDCFGAGQQVSQVTYGGVSWREQENLGEMAAVLSVMRLLHEMLSYLAEVDRRSPEPAAAELAAEIVRMTASTPNELLDIDLDYLHDRVGAVLESVSARLRSGADLRGRDLAGRDLRDHDLHDADLRGSVLIRADLRGLDLGRADLLGADLRDADLGGTELRETLFLSQTQANAASGDAATTLPQRLSRPAHWS